MFNNRLKFIFERITYYISFLLLPYWCIDRLLYIILIGLSHFNVMNGVHLNYV